MSTENTVASGNWGLWDGYYALQWVQANIARSVTQNSDSSPQGDFRDNFLAHLCVCTVGSYASLSVCLSVCDVTKIHIWGTA